MVSKNKQFPYSYKREIYSKLYDSDLQNSELLNIFNNKNIHYYDSLLNNFDEIKKSGIYSQKVLKLLNSTTGKILPDFIRKKLSSKIKKTKIEYINKTKSIIKSNNISDENLINSSGIIGDKIFNSLNIHDVFSDLNDTDIQLLSKKLNKLSKEQFLLVLENFKDGFSYIKIAKYFIDIFSKGDINKKYEYLFYFINGNKNTFDLGNNFGIEKYFIDLGLTDTFKNFELLIHLIKNSSGNINISNLNLEFLGDKNKFLHIFELLDNYKKLDSIVYYFEFFDFLSEEERYLIAKKIAKYDISLGKYINKFNIKNGDYLTDLANINSGFNLDDNKSINGDSDFINYYQNFNLDKKDFKFLSELTLNYSTKLDKQYFKPNNLEDFLFILEKFIIVKDLNKDDLIFLIEFGLQYYPEKTYDIIFKIGTFISDSLSVKENFLLISSNFGNHEIDIKSILYKGFFHNYIFNYGPITLLNKSNLFILNKEILLCILDEFVFFDIISQKLKNAILSDIKTTDSIVNYLKFIFDGNIIDKEGELKYEGFNIGNDIFPPENISKTNKNKFISRKAFFDKIGLNCSNEFILNNSVDFNEFYSMLSHLYEELGREFFKKLNFDINLKNYNNYLKFFKNINNLLLLKNLFLMFDRTEFVFLIKDLDFEFLLKYQKEKLEIPNIKNISNFNDFLITLTKNIFISKLEDINLTDEDFLLLIKKWGNISSLIGLIGYSNNENILEIAKRIINSDGEGKFLDYKYDGYFDDEFDIENAKKQIGKLSSEQKKLWQNNYLGIVKYNQDGLDKKSDFNLLDIIYNSFVLNSHLDEIEPGYKNKVLNLDKNSIPNDFYRDLNNIKIFDDFYEKYSYLGDYKLYLFLFNVLISRKLEVNNLNIINIINILKRLNNLNSFLPKNIILELNSFLNKNKLNNKKLEKEESFIFTIETDNPKILLEIGDMVSGAYSCQSIKNRSPYMASLPGYIIDAGVKSLLSFEITKKYFDNESDFQEFSNLIASEKYKIDFNPYHLTLKIGRFTFKLNKAISRNILKLGFENQFSKVPVMFLEKTYSSLHMSKLKILDDIHQKILQDKIKDISGKNITRESFFYKSRNPDGVYVDVNNNTETDSYTLRNI